jgi:hypothetical protein
LNTTSGEFEHPAITRLLERDVLGAQFSDQIGGLLERHVAIVRNRAQNLSHVLGTNSRVEA